MALLGSLSNPPPRYITLFDLGFFLSRGFHLLNCFSVSPTSNIYKKSQIVKAVENPGI